MKDLIDKILKYLPQYFLEFGSLLSGPKRFIAAKNLESDDVFGDACLFLAITLALVLIAGAPFKPPDLDFWAYVAIAFLTNGIAVILFSLVTRSAWWIVRGKASTKAFFVTYIYFYGAVTGMAVFLAALMRGFIKQSDRALYDVIVSSQHTEAGIPENVYEQMALAGKVIFIFGLLAIGIWCVVAWGAYRQISGLGRFRSLIAFVIALALSFPALLAVYYVSLALRA